MKHIVANLAWCSTMWRHPTPEGINFGYVRDGNLPHEGFNFAINHPRNKKPRNGQRVIYGHIPSSRVPRQYLDANNGQGIAFFISRKPKEETQWIIGLYGECEVLDKPKFHRRWEINIAAPRNRVIPFYPEAYVPFQERKYLNRSTPIGQAIYAYIEDPLAKKILHDALASHRRLFRMTPTNRELKGIVSRLEKLFATLGGNPSQVKIPKTPQKSRKRLVREQQVYEEGLTREMVVEVTQRNPTLARHVKERDGYICQVCGFIFEDFYGPEGEGVADCHHLIPVAEWTGARKSNPEDAITVCANCHRMLHRGKTLIDPDELRAQIKKQMKINKGPFHWF